MRQRELEADQERGGQRGELERRLAARHEVAGDRTDREQSDQDLLGKSEVRDPRSVVLAPAPDRERRVPAHLPAERPVPEDPGRVRRVRLEQEDREGGERGDDKTSCKSAFPERRRPSGYPAHNGTSRSAANFVHPASATNAPRPKADVTSQKPKMSSTGMIASFVFELDTYCVNGYAAQANGSMTASRMPPNRRPTSISPSSASRSKAIAVACTAGSLSQRPLQPSTARTPARTPRTQPARTCRRARSPTRSARSSAPAHGSHRRRPSARRLSASLATGM